MQISESDLGYDIPITILMIGHDVPPDGPVRLEDLAGGTGRLDVLIRGLQTGLLTSHGLRKDVVFDWLLCGGGEDRWRWVRWIGRDLRGVSADERSIGGHVRSVLSEKVARNRWTRHAPGLFSRRATLSKVLSSWKEVNRSAVVLSKDAPALEGPLVTGAKIGVVVSDHLPLSPDESNHLSEFGATEASIGSRWLQGHSAITLALAVFDGDVAILVV